jgi:uncharacterized protein YacL
MIVHITRFVFVAAGALGGFAVSGLIDWSDQTGYPQYIVIFIFIILGLSIGYVLGGIFGREFASAYYRAEKRLQDMAPFDLVLGVAGLIVGLAIAWLVSVPLRFIEPVWLSAFATVLLFMMLGSFGVRVAFIKKGDFARAMPGLSDPEAAGGKGELKVLDTSAIIDGRFSSLRDLGLLEGELRVPRFVLGELHTLSDSADDMRRARGRRGLDLLSRLRDDDARRVEVFEADYPDVPDVDNKLIRLAAETGAVVLTVDHNLTSVARVRGVGVLNLNEVASAMRPNHLPGERIRLRIVKEGKEPAQGVGYLEDGTMVVVAEGRDHIGTEADVEVTSVLQTSAGRMVFSRFLGQPSEGGDRDA